VADWVTISSLATAGGTLVLAVATFGSVRSANRAARAAERSMLAALRPLLLPSRLQDPPQKVGFADEKWLVVPGGGAAAEVGDSAIYLALSLRNVGTGLGVLHGWCFYPERALGGDSSHTPLSDFRRLSRDLYIPAGDIGFWQGAFRDPRAPEFAAARVPIAAGESVTLDLLYGDQDGGQRVITRFVLRPRADSDDWLGTVSRHWNVDRDDPR
jgi:hypothetical protein